MKRKARPVKQLRSKDSKVKGVAAGLIAGLAASLAMNFAMRVVAIGSSPSEQLKMQPESGSRLRKRVRRFQELGDPNQQILDRTSVYLFQRRIPQSLLQPAATSVHYAFGALLGLAYSAARGKLSGVTIGSGALFGVLWWGAVNEVLLPTIGLLEAPDKTPLRTHAAMLVSHIVYGVSLEAARREAMQWKATSRSAPDMLAA